MYWCLYVVFFNVFCICIYWGYFLFANVGLSNINCQLWWTGQEKRQWEQLVMYFLYENQWTCSISIQANMFFISWNLEIIQASLACFQNKPGKDIEKKVTQKITWTCIPNRKHTNCIMPNINILNFVES